MITTTTFCNNQPGKMSKGESAAMATILVLYSVVGGYFAGTQPSGAGWRLFSVRVSRLYVLPSREAAKDKISFSSSSISHLQIKFTILKSFITKR
jgi:hypothetical protein